MSHVIFIDFDICHQTESLQKSCSVTLTYIFKFKTVRSGTKMSNTTFIDFDMCHRIESAKVMLCDLDLYFQDNNYK